MKRKAIKFIALYIAISLIICCINIVLAELLLKPSDKSLIVNATVIGLSMSLIFIVKLLSSKSWDIYFFKYKQHFKNIDDETFNKLSDQIAQEDCKLLAQNKTLLFFKDKEDNYIKINYDDKIKTLLFSIKPKLFHFIGFYSDVKNNINNLNKYIAS